MQATCTEEGSDVEFGSTSQNTFSSTVVTGRVYTDETGASYEIPVILTAHGPVETVVDYLIEHWDTRSPAWMLKVAGAVRLFMQYLIPHQSSKNERFVFQNFRQRLLTGSIDRSNGTDPSNLWWGALRPTQASRIIRNLTDLFVWWGALNPGKSNPALGWRGSAHDLRLAEAAYQYSRNAAFLGHTWSTVSETSAKPGATGRTGKWHSPPRVEREAAPAFPEARLLDLVLKGFKVGDRYNYRDMLITLLLNGAGFRVSEPFHLYLWDVREDPSRKGGALVLIHHPAWGDAPPDPAWLNAAGKQRQGNRVEYLNEQFGLAPRDWVLSKSAAGWKGGMHERQFGGYYKQAYWFVPEFSDLFWKLWHLYIAQVQRIDPLLRTHPYAFVNTHRKPLGGVYKIGKYERSHAAAVRRIGLIPAKHLGTSIHGHRHAYGQRLRKAGVEKEMIRRFMHHADLESQQIYTEADRAECLIHLSKATDRLNSMSASVRDQIVTVNRDFMRDGI